MESPGQKVLYVIRHHASFPYVPRYSPLPQLQDSFIEFTMLSVLYLTLSFHFLSKFREMELIPEKGFGPIVSIKASISRSFTSGIWSENHYVLGLVDGLMEDDDGLKTSFIKYIALRMPENVLQLIDSMAGPFLPLNISLLLPDERIRSQCLSVVEYKLRQQGLPELSKDQVSQLNTSSNSFTASSTPRVPRNPSQKLFVTQVKKLRAILRDHGLIKKQISGVTSGEDTTEIPSVMTTKVYGTDQYNNQMVVASSCWLPYP
ncbi:hypothetical protein F2Q69_00000155 [Brassica cretica]|uniref:Uncharacterized protein n=1 Tax=Brassica cretica TaxID=69181 RepID=A0A8S9P8B3_BRACR|nr:hypothetical protein F2Q69_00000155 [Brassica cretica]